MVVKINIPIFQYEKLIYDSLLISDFYNPLKHTFKLKHLWVMMPQVAHLLCPSKMVNINRPFHIGYGNYAISMLASSSSFYDSLNNIIYLWIQSNNFEFYSWYKII